eukprot:gnl/MRDRNA2_/MRDRNA2_145851_c0_seq1.p1 gnl/MRDRNA2_/MRDRNA2_145851_c0~~gnl/MRDRNA2_/MRDRNA2_145851_c0_seq1.p1  ORF type:complete len:156 (-),score=39.22 gnl/MRDRNA2_/MRDRNA2_145851_c0_seq1:23-490(-)
MSGEANSRTQQCPASQTEQRPKSSPFSLDKEFQTFVQRLLKIAEPTLYSEEQLALATTPEARKKVHRALLDCKGKNGRFNLTKFCQHACGPEYSSLANCWVSQSQDGEDLRPPELRCRIECLDLCACVRAEWSTMLFSVSPGFDYDPFLSPPKSQ